MRQMTLLIVEDNPRDVRLIQRAFDKTAFQHDLRVVNVGDVALSYLKASCDTEVSCTPRPDLILLDLNLPRLDGHEVLRQCKQDDHLRHIPIVVLTTSGYDDDIRRAYEAGANAYLLKPVEFARFTEVMRQLSTFWLDIVELPPELEVERS
jgi:CheY-like chemotaxis protein